MTCRASCFAGTRPGIVQSQGCPRFALPRELTQPSVVLASFGGKDEPVRPIAAQEAAQQAIQQAGNAAATVGAAPQATPQAAVSPGPSRYTGEPISVNLKDVDLRDFFRLIHEISGLNVVLDPAVKGTLTIVLDEVPWDQALDIVLQNNGLDKQLNGNVLRIATRDTLKKEAETVSRRKESGKRRAGNGNRDPRAELRESGHPEGHLQEVSDFAGRHSGRSTFEPVDYSRHSIGDSDN